jgi:hypothetical protein
MVMAAVVLWMRSSPAPKTAAPEPRVAVRPDTQPPPKAPAAPRSPAHYTLGSESEVSTDGRLTPQRAAAAAERLRRAARFPPTSQPIEDNIDPIARTREPKRARSAPPNTDGPVLIAYPAVTDVEAPGSVILYAEVVEREDINQEELRRHERNPREDRIGARAIRGEVRNEAGNPVATVQFRDDGQEPDAEANDLFFATSLTPDPDKPKEFRGAFRVIVTAETVSGDSLKATTGFTYSVPSAHLTGQYRDKIVDGSLQIEAEVAVEEAGRYQLAGTLASQEAAMLGHAHEIVTLEPGTTWIPLKVYGLMFRDRMVDGPYTLWSVVLSTMGDDGTQQSDVVPAAHTTAAYKASEFSDREYGDPEKLEQADRIEETAAKRTETEQANGGQRR